MKGENVLITADFIRAFLAISPLHENHIAILRCHARAPERTRTAAQLAREVGYPSYSAINLQYGLLAARVGEALGLHDSSLGLLCEFTPPKTHGNEQWELIMRSAVASAVAEMAWL